MWEIVRLHNIPANIILDHDIRFNSHFRRKLDKSLGTKLEFNSPYYLQTDG